MSSFKIIRKTNLFLIPCQIHMEQVLELEIVDDGQGPGDDGHDAGGGRGLIGMRERVSLFGGELDVGPAAESGFRVHASLPFEEGR